MEHVPIFTWLLHGYDFWEGQSDSANSGNVADLRRGLEGWLNLTTRYTKEHAEITPDQREMLLQRIDHAGEWLQATSEEKDIDKDPLWQQVTALKLRYDPDGKYQRAD